MTIIDITLKGIFRDRTFRGIFVVSLFFLAIPSISTLSMRQVTELALTLCLSLVSFILLVLSVFLGGISIWKDMERRYTHSVLTLPLGRIEYLLGRFIGISLFLLLSTAVLGLLSMSVVYFVSLGYPPDRPVAWSIVVVAFFFDVLKCILLVALAIFFSSLSTSFFLPIFGTLAVFLVGGASQQAYDYVNSAAGQSLAPMIRQAASVLYFLLPNFSAFDLKVNAIYALDLDYSGLWLTLGYFFIYTALVLTLAAVIFVRREID